MKIFLQARAKKILNQKIYLTNEAYFTFVTLYNKIKQTIVKAIEPNS